MSGARIFDDEQLELLGTPTSIRLDRAAGARDLREAVEVAFLVEQESVLCGDGYQGWIPVLQDFIVRRAGQARHDEALRYAAEYALRPSVRAFAELDARGRIECVASRLRASGSTFSMHEDADRVLIEVEHWGPARAWTPRFPWQDSGMVRDRKGDRYVYPGFGLDLAPLSGARPLAQGRDSLPAFAATEILFLEILAIEELGAPIAVVTLPEEISSAALLEVYKDPADVPDSAYARVGMVRPRARRAGHGARLFTDEELERLATPLSIRVENAAKAEDWGEVRRVADEVDPDLIVVHDPLGILVTGLLTWIARHVGEEALEPVLDTSFDIGMEPFMGVVTALGPRELIPMWAMGWRSHGGTFWIAEEDDRFVFSGRQPTACARYWLPADPTMGRVSESRVRYPTYGLYDPPARFHVNREPRGMTCMEDSMPVYSAHCHHLEVWGIDRFGHPLWAEHHPRERVGDTELVYYKDPVDWPERYYARAGRQKGDSRSGTSAAASRSS